jgi:hypothetical protein
VAGDLEMMCCITATHGMMVMCKCDEISRELTEIGKKQGIAHGGAQWRSPDTA